MHDLRFHKPVSLKVAREQPRPQNQRRQVRPATINYHGYPLWSRHKINRRPDTNETGTYKCCLARLTLYQKRTIAFRRTSVEIIAHAELSRTPFRRKGHKRKNRHNQEIVVHENTSNTCRPKTFPCQQQTRRTGPQKHPLSPKPNKLRSGPAYRYAISSGPPPSLAAAASAAAFKAAAATTAAPLLPLE